MECGLNPDEFWNASWYELDLLGQRRRYQEDRQWDYTRHIMAAMGVGNGDPRKVLPLPFDKKRLKLEITTPEDALRILENYKIDTTNLKLTPTHNG